MVTLRIPGLRFRVPRTSEFGADIRLLGKGEGKRSGKMPGDAGQPSQAFSRAVRYGLKSGLRFAPAQKNGQGETSCAHCPTMPAALMVLTVSVGATC